MCVQHSDVILLLEFFFPRQTYFAGIYTRFYVFHAHGGDQRGQVRHQRYAGDRAGLFDRRFVNEKRHVDQGHVDQQFTSREHDGHLVQLETFTEFEYFVEIQRPVLFVRNIFTRASRTSQEHLENQRGNHPDRRGDQC